MRPYARAFLFAAALNAYGLLVYYAVRCDAEPVTRTPAADYREPLDSLIAGARRIAVLLERIR